MTSIVLLDHDKESWRFVLSATAYSPALRYMSAAVRADIRQSGRRERVKKIGIAASSSGVSMS